MKSIFSTFFFPILIYLSPILFTFSSNFSVRVCLQHSVFFVIHVGFRPQVIFITYLRFQTTLRWQNLQNSITADAYKSFRNCPAQFFCQLCLLLTPPPQHACCLCFFTPSAEALEGSWQQSLPALLKTKRNPIGCWVEQKILTLSQLRSGKMDEPDFRAEMWAIQLPCGVIVVCKFKH